MRVRPPAPGPGPGRARRQRRPSRRSRGAPGTRACTPRRTAPGSRRCPARRTCSRSGPRCPSAAPGVTGTPGFQLQKSAVQDFEAFWIFLVQASGFEVRVRVSKDLKRSCSCAHLQTPRQPTKQARQSPTLPTATRSSGDGAQGLGIAQTPQLLHSKQPEEVWVRRRTWTRSSMARMASRSACACSSSGVGSAGGGGGASSSPCARPEAASYRSGAVSRCNMIL